MGTATTQELLTIIWGLHIGIGEDCEASRRGRCREVTSLSRAVAGVVNNAAEPVQLTEL